MAWTAFSQQPEENISLTFESLTVPEALEMFNRESPYQVFFLDSWFTEDRISGNYQEMAPEAILKEILNATEVSYYRYGEQVFVLTRNNQIYDQLPQGFFGRPRDTTGR